MYRERHVKEHVGRLRVVDEMGDDHFNDFQRKPVENWGGVLLYQTILVSDSITAVDVQQNVKRWGTELSENEDVGVFVNAIAVDVSRYTRVLLNAGEAPLSSRQEVGPLDEFPR